MNERDLLGTAVRYEAEFSTPFEKRTSMDVWQLRMDICRALADNAMNVSKAARQVYRHRNDVVYHIEKMRESGFDPLDFHQLALMLGYVRMNHDAKKI